MKKLFLIAILTFSLIAYGEDKVVSYLQDRNGTFYEVNTEKSFTGKWLTKYDNGQKKAEANFKDDNEIDLLNCENPY